MVRWLLKQTGNVVLLLRQMTASIFGGVYWRKLTWITSKLVCHPGQQSKLKRRKWGGCWTQCLPRVSILRSYSTAGNLTSRCSMIFVLLCVQARWRFQTWSCYGAVVMGGRYVLGRNTHSGFTVLLVVNVVLIYCFLELVVPRFERNR